MPAAIFTADDELWGVCSVRRCRLGRFEGISDIRPLSDATDELVEPSSVVEAMASAVDRVRRMAATVFRGDAALFDDTTDEATR
jgi:hypothetical protein